MYKHKEYAGNIHWKFSVFTLSYMSTLLQPISIQNLQMLYYKTKYNTCIFVQSIKS